MHSFIIAVTISTDEYIFVADFFADFPMKSLGTKKNLSTFEKCELVDAAQTARRPMDVKDALIKYDLSKTVYYR